MEPTNADRLAALEARVADLEEIHAAELGVLRAQRAAADPEARAARAAATAQIQERNLAVRAVQLALVNVNNACRSLRKELEHGRSWPVGAAALREAVERLADRMMAVSILVERKSWQAGDEALLRADEGRRTAEKLLAEHEAAQRALAGG